VIVVYGAGTFRDSHIVAFLRKVMGGQGCVGVEHTDAWVFESLRRVEEKKLRDPDDVYYLVREREEERAKEGLPPLIRFLDDQPATRKAKSTK
jgi:hypothetical protein